MHMLPLQHFESKLWRDESRDTIQMPMHHQTIPGEHPPLKYRAKGCTLVFCPEPHADELTDGWWYWFSAMHPRYYNVRWKWVRIAPFQLAYRKYSHWYAEWMSGEAEGRHSHQRNPTSSCVVVRRHYYCVFVVAKDGGEERRGELWMKESCQQKQQQ